MIEKFTEFTAQDAEIVKKYETVFNNAGRLLSKIFTLAITEIKFALQRGQDWPPYRGWIFKFKDFTCWYGISLSSQSFLMTRFQVRVDEGGDILSDLKEKGYEAFTWGAEEGTWLWKEQPSDLLKITDKDQQVRKCIDILKEHLFAIESVL